MAKLDYKPAGYPNVSVYMMAKGAEDVIAFARATFDAELGRDMRRPDGTIMHAEIRIGDSIVMLSEATADYPGFPVWLHVYVPDVDEAYRRALQAGGESVQAPEQKGDEDKRGGVKDPAGNVWWISTRMG